jgi:hypothetical protein
VAIIEGPPLDTIPTRYIARWRLVGADLAHQWVRVTETSPIDTIIRIAERILPRREYGGLWFGSYSGAEGTGPWNMIVDRQSCPLDPLDIQPRLEGHVYLGTRPDGTPITARLRALAALDGFRWGAEPWPRADSTSVNPAEMELYEQLSTGIGLLAGGTLTSTAGAGFGYTRSFTWTATYRAPPAGASRR